MKCVYHPDQEASAQCAGCGAALCDRCTAGQAGGQAVRCPRCAALSALDDLQAQTDDRQQGQARRDAAQKRKKTILRVLEAVLIVAAVAIVIYRLPAVVGALNMEEKPIRRGTYATDPATDACIRQMWQIAKRLQQGKTPGPDIRCPASNRPYRLEETPAGIVAHCPNPEAHRLTDIRVDARNPAPVLVK